MSNPLVDRIDETREKWAGELSECREAISIGINVPLDRMVVELDYLVVEAKQALITLEQSNSDIEEQANEPQWDSIAGEWTNVIHDEKMKEPWIARTCWDGNARFELHIGGNNHVLSLEKGKRLAGDILLLLREEDDIPF